MNGTTPRKFFSEYQLLRLTNPSAFYRTKIQEEMSSARAYYGSDLFYDLHEARGNLL